MVDDAYLDYIRPRGLPLLKATLRVIVAVQCFGAAARTLSMGLESKIAGFLLSDFAWPQAKVDQFDLYIAYGLMACGVLTLLRPSWVLLLPVTLWFAATAAMPLVQNEGTMPMLEPLQQASRWAAPLGLLILDFWPPSLKSHLGRTVTSMWLLRLAAAATFAGLGLTALRHSMEGGEAMDLLTATSDKVFGREMTPTNAQWALTIIGGMELGLALNVIAGRSKPLVTAMAVWGFATAATYVVLLGPQAFAEAMLRVANGGLPLVLVMYWTLSIKEAPVEVVKAN